MPDDQSTPETDRNIIESHGEEKESARPSAKFCREMERKRNSVVRVAKELANALRHGDQVSQTLAAANLKERALASFHAKFPA